MSFVVHIFAWPNEPYFEDQTRWSNAQFFDAFDSLQGKRREFANIGFQVLAKRLTARYPCISSSEADEEEGEWAWTDGPLDGKTQEHNYGIGINSNLLDEVLPFVVREAGFARLNVYDQQQGIIFCADGKVIRFHDGHQQQKKINSSSPVDDLLPKTKDSAQQIIDELLPFLKARSFNKIKTDVFYYDDHQTIIDFLKTAEGLNLIFRFSLSQEIEKNYVNVNVSLHLRIPTVNFWLYRVLDLYGGLTDTLSINVTDYLSKSGQSSSLLLRESTNTSFEYRFRNQADLQQVAKDLHQGIRKYLRPMLLACDSLDSFVLYLLNLPLIANPFFSKYKYAGAIAATCSVGGQERARGIAQEILNFYISEKNDGRDPLNDVSRSANDTFKVINAILSGDTPKKKLSHIHPKTKI